MKMLYTGCSTKDANHCFFPGAPGVSRKDDFCRRNFGESRDIKMEKVEPGYCTFWNYYIQGAPRKKQ